MLRDFKAIGDKNWFVRCENIELQTYGFSAWDEYVRHHEKFTDKQKACFKLFADHGLEYYQSPCVDSEKAAWVIELKKEINVCMLRGSDLLECTDMPSIIGYRFNRYISTITVTDFKL